jgi:hypothetical protein
MKMTIIPAMPTAKNLAEFSLFLCLSTFAKALAFTAAVVDLFAIMKDLARVENKLRVRK